MIDAHAHLTDDAFDTDLPAILKNARDAGLEAIINPGTDPASSEAAIALSAANPGFIFAAAGVHPHEAEAGGDSAIPRLKELVASARVIGIGETGLDFYRDLSPRPVQVSMFERHIELAAETGLPLIVHVRDAYPEIYDILSKYPGVTGMIHSFSDGPDFAKKLVALGYMLSFSGMLTYPKAGLIREAATCVPLDRFLLETDAPYLPPQRRRGRRCEPAYVAETARKFAEIRGLTMEEISRASTENACHLFKLALPVS
ncbi:MAG: TatD family hydrolase [bacterium]